MMKLSLFECTFLMSSLLTTLMDAKSIRKSVPRWHIPCGETMTSVSDVPVVAVPLDRVLSMMSSQTSETSIGSTRIKHIYRDRIENIDYLNTLDGYPPLEGLQMDYIHGNITSTILVNIVEALKEDYQQLSLIAVYWEAMIGDQIEYEFGIHVEDMRNTENDLYSALCTLYTGIHYTLSSNIEAFVDRSAMPNYIRDSGSDPHIRQNRNYLKTKDASAILDYLSERYDFLYTQLSSMMLS